MFFFNLRLQSTLTTDVRDVFLIDIALMSVNRMRTGRMHSRSALVTSKHHGIRSTSKIVVPFIRLNRRRDRSALDHYDKPSFRVSLFRRRTRRRLRNPRIKTPGIEITFRKLTPTEYPLCYSLLISMLMRFVPCCSTHH
jgi:hypothetical protein